MAHGRAVIPTNNWIITDIFIILGAPDPAIGGMPMLRLYEEDLYHLPHPARVDAVLGQPLDTLLLQDTGLYAALQPWLADARAPSEWLLNTVPGLPALAARYAAAPGATNLGTFLLLLIRARLRAQGNPVAVVSPALQNLLAATSLARALTLDCLRRPSPLLYIAFARPNPWRISNALSGLHECEGAYLGQFTVAPGQPLFAHAARARALGLDPRRPAHVIEIIITGSPLGKRNALDDASRDLVLIYQDAREPLARLLERHFAWYTRATDGDAQGLTPLPAGEVPRLRPILDQLALVLLYLNLGEPATLRAIQGSDLLLALRRLGADEGVSFVTAERL